jgi:formylglycine-generating enzyme required for sulfatase activity
VRCDGIQILFAKEKRCLKPKESFKECDVCPEMVVVPAGSFMMGSPEYGESPVRKVSIARPFALGKFEMTFAQWDACVTDGGCKYIPSDNGFGRGNRPVIRVSWNDITNEYLPWLNRKVATIYRLPREAEWEYAARAGSTTNYFWGDEIGTNRANCSDCGSQWDGSQTAPVGSFAGNGFGLHDMHGNASEWVHDCHSSSYENAPSDGTAAPEVAGCFRLARGGGFKSEPKLLRSASRSTGFSRLLAVASG